MTRLLPHLRKRRNAGNHDKPQQSYDPWCLVSSQENESYPGGDASVQFICDIDKTYLETQFESLITLAKIAFEDAADKITVQGASELLLALRWGDMDDLSEDSERFPRPLHFVSSSPPQLRQVLREKLTMDGLDWTSDTFKDQAYNLRRGRFDLLKHQVGYKSAAILSVIAKQSAANPTFYLIGDSAESDAYIYMGIKLLVEKRISQDGYRRYLSFSGVNEQTTNRVLARIDQPLTGRVGGILIRSLDHYEFANQPPLTDPITHFTDYYDVGLYFASQGLLTSAQVYKLSRDLHNHYLLTPASMLQRLTWFTDKRLLGASFVEGIQQKLFSLTKERHFTTPRSLCDSPWFNHSQFDDLQENEILEYAEQWAYNLEESRHKKTKS